jgi:hypothetical protein
LAGHQNAELRTTVAAGHDPASAAGGVASLRESAANFSITVVGSTAWESIITGALLSGVVVAGL